MHTINRILQGLAFAVMLVCIGVLLELLLIGVLEGAFRLRPKPGIWMVVFPALFGLVGFRIGLSGGLDGIMMLAGVKAATAQRLGHAWLAGFALWAVAIWMMVERLGPFKEGPFGQYRWDARQWLLLVSILGGPPLLAVILMWAVQRVRRARA